ncbi:zinc-binding protein A33-like [Protopterus annectens]|uniref:zinc-binding protein A33-like n=1 Tax=Protopterus annectens TaxID=7888 RepID=UPI001CFB5F7A|nr:zinc-binding protein A33-like [Protopterus annectens]
MDFNNEAGNLAEDLTCPVCLDMFHEPVTLECGHNFCNSCVSTFWDSQLFPSCPECRQEFQTRKCIINRALANVAEKTQRLKWGCESQQLLHLCTKHEERLQLFCTEDESLVCVMCVPKHPRHNLISLQEAVRMYQDKLRKTTPTLESVQKELQNLQKKQEQKLTDIKEKVVNLQQHITSEFSILHVFLRAEEDKLLQNLRKEAAEIQREMEENLRKIQEENNVTKEMIADVQSRMRQSESVSFLTDIKNLAKNCSEKYKNAKPKSTLVKRDLSRGVYKGPLQYKVWKQMLAIICPGLSPLKLDQRTSHPKLILSRDLTSVKHADKWQDLPDNPERFDRCVCVVSSQGFTSGKHYWEAEVGAKTHWSLGVSSESANRKGSITTCPANGYWIMWLKHGMIYEAQNSPPKVLALTKKPQKIGVYLDYEGGQVSFYDADDMSHIYTFTNIFKSKLYPLFSPDLNFNGANGDPLKIFQLVL